MSATVQLPPNTAESNISLAEPTFTPQELITASCHALRWVLRNQSHFAIRTLTIDDRQHLQNYIDALQGWQRVPDRVSAEYFAHSAERLLMPLSPSIAERQGKQQKPQGDAYFRIECCQAEPKDPSPSIANGHSKEIFMAAMNFSLRLVGGQIAEKGFTDLPPRLEKLFHTIPRLTHRSPSGHRYREKTITLKGQELYRIMQANLRRIQVNSL